MAIETVFEAAGYINPFREDFQRFSALWDAVKSKDDWYWSGKRETWEWKPPQQYNVTATSDGVAVDQSQPPLKVFRAVDDSWGRVWFKLQDGIWNPRNGAWSTYAMRPNTTPPPPPPVPKVPEPVWKQRMKEELAVIETLPLSPGEKARAKDLVMERYLGKP